jgi:hypothetical protein
MSCLSNADIENQDNRQERLSSCVSYDQFDNCIPDYQGNMYVKSRYLGIWRKCSCRISGTKIFFSTNETCILTPANHIIRYVEFFNFFGIFHSKYRYIIHVADGSRIILSMRIDNEEDWGSWVLHFNLALSLSIKLQPASMLYSTNAMDFDGYFHRNAIEMMIQCFAIIDLIHGREKFRELQKLSSIHDSSKFQGLQEQRLRLAFELQCAKILLEILRSLVVSSPNEYEYALHDIEHFHRDISSNELSNSNLLTSYIDDYCYQRIRQFMVSNLKTLGSVRSMSVDQGNTLDPAVSPSSLSQSMKIVTILSFASVYLFNISLFSSNYSLGNHQGFLSYISPQSFGINRDLHFKNGDIMSCVIASFNQRIMTCSSKYVKFFVNILCKRYPNAVIACDDILGNNYIPIRYIRGWGALITAARSGNVKLFEYMLHRFIQINPPKQWINWKELLINACGCNQNIALIELLLRKFEAQRLITPAEVLVLLFSSIDAKIDVLVHFLTRYSVSSADDSPEVNASASFSSMRRSNRVLPTVLDRQSLLHVAAAGVRVDLVELLTDWQPSQISTEDNRGFYPLHVACSLSSSIEIVRYLYKHHPEALHHASSSNLDVYWPDLSYRSSIPIHLAATSCLSVEILKFLYEQHVKIEDSESLLRLTKYCLFRCISQRQSFTSTRIDCIKFFIRQLKDLAAGNLALATIDHHQSEVMTPLSNHYTYLPPYEYMPNKSMNQHLIRVMYRHDVSDDFKLFYNDEIYHQLNWDARKAALLIWYHYRRNAPTSRPVSMYSNATMNRPAEMTAEILSLEQASCWRRWIVSQDENSNTLMDLMSCSVSKGYAEIALLKEGVWIEVVQHDDIFRQCVSYL